MAEIKLNKGYSCLVDDEDYDNLKDFTWYVHVKKRRDGTERCYAYRSVWEDGRARAIIMHREILRVAKPMEVDHADGNGLNNTRANLRAVTRSQNNQNRSCESTRSGVPKSSRFKGVSFSKNVGKWHCYISINGRRRNLGWLSDEIAAARLYNSAARELFGEFAKLNMVEGV